MPPVEATESEVQVGYEYALEKYGKALNHYWIRLFTNEVEIERQKSERDFLDVVVYILIRNGLPQKTERDQERFAAYLGAVTKIFNERSQHARAAKKLGERNKAIPQGSIVYPLVNDPHSIAGIVRFARQSSNISWDDSAGIRQLIANELKNRGLSKEEIALLELEIRQCLPMIARGKSTWYQPYAPKNPNKHLRV